MKTELIDRIDAEIVALEADIATFKNALGDDAELGAEIKTLAVLRDCKSALSQREAQPVAQIVESISDGGMDVRWNPEYSPSIGEYLYSGPPKPAALPQTVASSQDVEPVARVVTHTTGGNPGLAKHVEWLPHNQSVMPGDNLYLHPQIVAPDVAEFIAKYGIHDEVWYGDVLSDHTYIDCSDLRAWMAGHARVPVEPTHKMCIAGNEILPSCVNSDEVYKTMLTASKESQLTAVSQQEGV